MSPCWYADTYADTVTRTPIVLLAGASVASFARVQQFDHFQLSAMASVPCAIAQAYYPPWSLSPKADCTTADNATIAAYGAGYVSTCSSSSSSSHTHPHVRVNTPWNAAVLLLMWLNRGTPYQYHRALALTQQSPCACADAARACSVSARYNSLYRPHRSQLVRRF